MRELQFALRAKGDWGKVKEDQLDEADVVYGAQASPLSMANKKKMNENFDSHEAARSEGRSHAMGGHSYSCRHRKGTMEAKCYHEGYVQALEECYGSPDMVEEGSLEDYREHPFNTGAIGKKNVPLTPPPSRLRMAPSPIEKSPVDPNQMNLPLNQPTDKTLDEELDEMMDEEMMDEMGRGDWMKHTAKTTPGDTFKAFGQTFNDREVLESDPVFENWDNQLNQLLKEGLTVTTSSGQQNMPDSISINATDEDAKSLAQMLKMSGLGSSGNTSGSESPVGSTDYEQEEFGGEDGGEESGMGSLKMPSGKHFSHNVEPEEMEPIKPYDHDEVIDGLDCADSMHILTNKLMALESMEMPDGMGMSTPAKDKDRKAPDPFDQDEILNALEKGGPKDSSKKSIKKSDATEESGDSRGEREQVTEADLPMPAGKGMSKNVPEKGPKPKKALEYDNVIDALDGVSEKPAKKSPFGKKGIAEDSTLSMPAGKGMSKNTNEPAPTNPLKSKSKTLDQKTVVSKLGKSSKLSENTGLPMPDGMGMSTPAKDKEQKIPEPKDLDSVTKELSKEGGKEEAEADKAFAALKRMIQTQMPKDTSGLPKADSVSDMPEEPSDNFGKVSSEYENSEEEYGAKSYSKKVEESSETCNECGEMMEEEHQCESKKLDEWANSLRTYKNSKLADEQFYTDSDYMINTNSGGLNRKKTDQTVNPHTKVKVTEDRDEIIKEWLKLSGIIK
jgi:hypothetical protein